MKARTRVRIQVAYQQYNFYEQALEARVQNVDSIGLVKDGFWVDERGTFIGPNEEAKYRATNNMFWIPPNQILGISRTHIIAG